MVTETETETRPAGAEPVAGVPVKEAPAKAEATTGEPKAEAAPQEPDYKALLEHERIERQKLEHKVSSLEGLARSGQSAEGLAKMLMRSQRISALANAKGQSVEEVEAAFTALERETVADQASAANLQLIREDKERLAYEVYEAFKDGDTLLADVNKGDEAKEVRRLWAEGEALEATNPAAAHAKFEAARFASVAVAEGIKGKTTKAEATRAKQEAARERGDLDQSGARGEASRTGSPRDATENAKWLNEKKITDAQYQANKRLRGWGQ